MLMHEFSAKLKINVLSKTSGVLLMISSFIQGLSNATSRLTIILIRKYPFLMVEGTT